MKNGYHIDIQHISIFFALVFAISACTVHDSSVNPVSINIKSETKWLLDNNTEKKSTIIYTKEYDINAHLIRFDEFNSTGAVVLRSIYKYIDTFSIESKNYYSNNGAIDSMKNIEYFYNSSGRVSSIIEFSTNGDTSNITTYNYNNNGNISKMLEYQKNGKVFSEINYSYKYDNQGNVQEIYTNPTNTGQFQSRDSLIYKINERFIERVYFNSIGSVTGSVKYIYNGYGQITKEINYNSDKQITTQYLYEYSYF